MFNDRLTYPVATEGDPRNSLAMETVEQKLERKKKDLETALDETNKALDFLKSNPTFLEGLNLLRKVGI